MFFLPTIIWNMPLPYDDESSCTHKGALIINNLILHKTTYTDRIYLSISAPNVCLVHYVQLFADESSIATLRAKIAVIFCVYL